MIQDVVRKYSGVMVHLTCAHALLLRLNISSLLELGRAAEGRATCGTQAAGPRLVSVLARHAVGYKTMALRGACLSAPQGQGPDICCFEILAWK